MTAPPPTTWASCCTSAATRTRRPAGGVSPPSPGSAAAAHALGRHYRERGDEPGRRVLAAPVRRAGHALGAYALADLLEHRSDVGAERWLRAAAEQGHREAAYRLARALDRAATGDGRGERAPAREAEQWYRQAAARGHRRAALHLGAILEKRGELKEAGRWYLTSAKDGESRAACALGFLLRDAGDEESAAVWWLRAAQDGDGNAANALGALHAARGEQQTAERWYRAAMDAGDVNGAYNLGLLCAAQDRTAQAEQWYRRAAYAGHREAANALAVLLLQAGDPTGRRAVVLQGGRGGQRGRRVQSRHPATRGATTTARRCAGTSARRRPGTPRRRSRSASRCLRDGDERSAERHLRCAAGGGSAEAAFRLAALLDSRQPPPGPTALGEPHAVKSECEQWYERAAEQGHRRAQVRVGMLAAARGDVADAGALVPGGRRGGQPQRCLQPRSAARA